ECVYGKALGENVRKYKEMSEALETFKPDAVFAMERGGTLVGDVLTELAPDLKVVSMTKPGDGKPEQAAAIGKRIEEGIARGQTRFAVVDFNFDGHTLGEMNKMAAAVIAAHPGVDLHIETHWIRETLGFEDRVAGGERTLRSPGERITNLNYEVRYAV